MKQIDHYIEEKKALKPSVSLEERIMATVQSLPKEKPMTRRIPLWQNVAVVASVALVIMAGVKIGTSYSVAKNTEYVGLIINDDYIEQLSIYTEYEK